MYIRISTPRVLEGVVAVAANISIICWWSELQLVCEASASIVCSSAVAAGDDIVAVESTPHRIEWDQALCLYLCVYCCLSLFLLVLALLTGRLPKCSLIAVLYVMCVGAPLDVSRFTAPLP